MPISHGDVVKFGWDVAEDGDDRNVLTEMRGRRS